MGCGALILFLLICLVVFPIIGFNIGIVVVIGGVILALVAIHEIYDSICIWGDHDDLSSSILILLASIGVILAGIWVMSLFS